MKAANSEPENHNLRLNPEKRILWPLDAGKQAYNLLFLGPFSMLALGHATLPRGVCQRLDISVKSVLIHIIMRIKLLLEASTKSRFLQMSETNRLLSCTKEQTSTPFQN